MKTHRFAAGDHWIEIDCLNGRPTTLGSSVPHDAFHHGILCGIKHLLYTQAAEGVDLDDPKVKKAVETVMQGLFSLTSTKSRRAT